MLICNACPKGKFASGSGATMCTLCAAGRYSTTTNTTACTACEKGTYQTGCGYTTCVSCDPGTYQTSLAQTTSSSCTKCKAGSYSEKTGMTNCTACAAGAYSSTAGATVCSLCVAGTFSPKISSSACASCTVCDPDATTYGSCPTGSTQNSISWCVYLPSLPRSISVGLGKGMSSHAPPPHPFQQRPTAGQTLTAARCQQLPSTGARPHARPPPPAHTHMVTVASTSHLATTHEEPVPPKPCGMHE